MQILLAFCNNKPAGLLNRQMQTTNNGMQRILQNMQSANWHYGYLPGVAFPIFFGVFLFYLRKFAAYILENSTASCKPHRNLGFFFSFNCNANVSPLPGGCMYTPNNMCVYCRCHIPVLCVLWGLHTDWGWDLLAMSSAMSHRRKLSHRPHCSWAKLPQTSSSWIWTLHKKKGDANPRMQTISPKIIGLGSSDSANISALNNPHHPSLTTYRFNHLIKENDICKETEQSRPLLSCHTYRASFFFFNRYKDIKCKYKRMVKKK